MPTFTWTPEFGSTCSKKPAVTTARFGDGYEARQAPGLNTDPETWSVRFMNREIAEIDAINAFLTALKGVTGFDWTPPRQASPRRFKCSQWDRGIDHPTTDSLTALFVEIFEP